ncbi:MAG: hypothetical protein ABW189_09145 [Rickettsiales bacterium]
MQFVDGRRVGDRINRNDLTSKIFDALGGNPLLPGSGIDKYARKRLIRLPMFMCIFEIR